MWEQRAGGSAAIADYAEGYTYDHNANRLTKTLNAAQVDTYAYDANNKLLSVQGGISGSRTYGYDQNGNTTSVNANGTTTTLRWDDEGHPYWIGQGNGQFSTYSYSGLGQRAFYHSANGVNHYNTFSGEDPAASLLSDGTATYTPGISEHRASDNASYYYASDAQGSLRFLRDSNGNASEDSRYDGFGVVAYKQNAPTTPFGFVGAQGYHTDIADSGLMLLGNRYYDAGVGRFLSRDPAKDGNNWYAYCGNDPLTHTDRTGLSADPAHFTTQFDTLGMSIGSLEDAGWHQGTAQEMLDHDFQQNQINGVVGDIAYGASKNVGGNQRITIEVGIAICIEYYNGSFHFNWEPFVSYGLQQGVGFGNSAGPSFGIGIGDLEGFNGNSFTSSFVTGAHAGLGTVYNEGYMGLDISPGRLSTGVEEGIYPTGISGTTPITIPPGLFGAPVKLHL